MNAVFLDTSIVIARNFHDESVRARINETLSHYDFKLIGLTVVQEYKRRVLQQAKYLLNLLNALSSFKRVQRHVLEVLPLQKNRQKVICLEMLMTIFEDEDDSDLTERATLYLRSLLLFGIENLENSVDCIVRDTMCACAAIPIIEKKAYKQYEFGTDKCSNKKNTCGIAKFLKDRMPELQAIKDQISAIPQIERTKELNDVLDFIGSVIFSPEKAPDHDPCLKVGDLLIALESKNTEDFYTLNFKESRHLCRALNQNLLVGRSNPDRPEQLLRKEESVWNLNP